MAIHEIWTSPETGHKITTFKDGTQEFRDADGAKCDDPRVPDSEGSLDTSLPKASGIVERVDSPANTPEAVVDSPAKGDEPVDGNPIDAPVAVQPDPRPGGFGTFVEPPSYPPDPPQTMTGDPSRDDPHGVPGEDSHGEG